MSVRVLKNRRPGTMAFAMVPVFLIAAAESECQATAIRDVVVIAARAEDARVIATREAVAHWISIFADLGLPTPFGKVKVVQRTVPEDLVAAYARSIVGNWRRPTSPNELTEIPGDIVIVLSDAEFLSFAVPVGNSGRRLIGIRSDRRPPLSLPNVARNILAHELGHALGLGHNRDPAMLMCGRPASCRPDLYRSTEVRFFPLTDSERRMLFRRRQE